MRIPGMRNMPNTDSEGRKSAGGRILVAALGVLALAVAVVPPPRAAAQISTTTVQGTIYRADGTAASGTVLVSWAAFTTPQNQAVAAGSLSTTIGADGFVSVNLTPNAGALPGGSYYAAVYHLNDGTVNKEYWVVPASGTASVASVRAQLQPSTVAVQPVTPAYVNSAVASISSSYLPLAGGSLSGPLNLNADPSAPTQAATKHYADQIAAASLPLSGGNVAGTVSTQVGQNKQPRVDVTHPDFGIPAGCPNAADPAGINDSTCAINAAITFLLSQKNSGQYPALYIPRGTFKVNGTIRLPAFVNIMGDGPQSSILQETNATANLLTFALFPGYANNAYSFGGSIRDLELEGNGHSTTGTLLELQNGALSLNNVLLYNHGGRGIVGYENSETTKIWNLQVQQVRWPLVIGAYEYRINGIAIRNPGQDASGYCWNLNCVNGVFPGPLPSSIYSLVSASGDGTTQKYVFGGNGGVSPLAVGNYLYTNAIAGTNALNGYWHITGVANNSPVSGQFTVTVSGTANGIGTVMGATFGTALVPENRHAAVWVSGGYENTFEGGEMKILQFLPSFKFVTANNTRLTDTYEEGYLNSIHPSILIGGLPDQMHGNGTTTSCTIGSNSYACIPTTSDSMWWPAYIGLSSDIPANGAGIASVNGNTWTYVFPCDYNPASSAPSSCNPTVQQNQYEVAYVEVAGDTGSAYFLSRNLSGSTAPASTAWVNPVFEMVPNGLSTGTGLTMARNELIADNPSSLQNGYIAWCQDATIMQCAEIEAGSMDDGYIHFTYGWNTGGNPTSVNTVAQLETQDTFAPGYPETTGFSWIKDSSRASVYYPVSAPSVQPEGGEIAASGGSLTQSSVVPQIQVTSPTGMLTVNSPSLNYRNVGYGAPPYFLQELAGNNASLNGYFGGNPGPSGWTMGQQIFGSRCWYGSGSSTHSDFRTCVTDSNSGKANFEVDSWNGTAWTTLLSTSASATTAGNMTLTGSLRAQGSISGSQINGEITVDGLTYSSLNAAWTAAVNQANATGQNQTVHLGPGTYSVNATMSEPTNGACVSVLGSAGTTVAADSTQVATIISIPGTLNGDLFYLGNSAQAQGCTFRDLNILAGGHATHGFELQWFRGLLIDNVTVNDTTAEGILLGEENTAAGHQANFLLRNTTVSYSSAAFTPANRPAWGIHIEKTGMDSTLNGIVVRNALTAAIYNEGTGNTGYGIHGFGYPYTCTTGPCSNSASSGSAGNASYATSYVIYDTGGAGSVWTDTYVDSPAVAGFYVGANGIAIHGGHIQWPDVSSFPAANLAYVASAVTNNLLIADVDCLEMANGVNWITYAGASGNPPTYASVHHLTGCGNYYQALEPANVTGFSSGGANINDPSGAVPRVWSTPIAASASYSAYAAQLYNGYQGDVFQAHFSGASPFFNVTYQGTIRSSGGLALSTIINTASTLTLTAANKNVIANTTTGAQTITLPSCYTPLADNTSPTGLELTISKSDSSANAVTLQTTSSQLIYAQGSSAQTLILSSPSTQTLVCGPDYNWYVTATAPAAGGTTVSSFNGRSGAVTPAANDYSFSQIGGQATNAQLPSSLTASTSGNAATATALAATPSQCSTGYYAKGITAGGAANCSQSWHFTWYGSFAGTFGTATNTSLGSIWTPTASVSMTRLDIALGTAPAGCSTWPVIGIYDGTSSTWLKTVTLASATYSYRNTVSSVSITAGHNLSMGVQTAGSGCSTNPASAQITMEYTMNQ